MISLICEALVMDYDDTFETADLPTTLLVSSMHYGVDRY
jgi:hypothetical protein